MDDEQSTEHEFEELRSEVVIYHNTLFATITVICVSWLRKQNFPSSPSLCCENYAKSSTFETDDITAATCVEGGGGGAKGGVHALFN